MTYGIVKWIIISLILIILIHHIFDFFKNTMTVPKVKNLVHNSSKLYKEIDNIIDSNNDILVKISEKKPNALNELNESNELNKSNELNENTNKMKDELKNFFDELKNNTPDVIPSIDNSAVKMYTEL